MGKFFEDLNRVLIAGVVLVVVAFLILHLSGFTRLQRPKLAHLRAIDLGGEAVFGSDVELFRRHTRDGCILVNHLAATEASVVPT